MDYGYPPAVEAFRAELRAWLEANVPPGLRGLAFADGLSRARIEELRAWNRRLADAGWAAISWPVEYGGRGAGVLEQVVFAEETARAEAPPPLNPIGLANIAPAIMAHGSAEQKRELLPRMLRGDHIWCQGFSEPDAGSDLASLRTSARLSGDHFLVNGQKVWTTLGEHADWCELLVRSDPAAPRHAGISALLVPMKLPGIEVRPLRTNTGGSEFSQIFFTDVRVPASALLGPLHGGWSVAMTTLTHERAGVASLHLGVRRKIARLLAAAREHRVDGHPASDDPRLRRRLARCYLLGEQLRFLADRAVSAAAKGRDPGAESSLAKLTWSDVEHEIARTAGAVLGPEANAGRWGHERLYAPSTSIAGGTTQVNKNIIAQRVLGLPKAG
jgi:alkylation response protein AidB-like acyl-CoA dehydrogenase